MFEQIFTYLQDLIKNNQFAEAGITTTLFLGAGVYLKTLYYKTAEFIDRNISTTIVIDDKDGGGASFDFIERFFSRKSDHISNWGYTNMNLGYSKYYRWYKCRPVVVIKSRIEQQQRHYNEIRVKTWFNRNIKSQLMDESNLSRDKYITVGNNLNMMTLKVKPQYLVTESAKILKEKIKRIKTLWNAGEDVSGSFLLYGPPGEGKSRSIKNIATELGINLNVVSISPETTNAELSAALCHHDSSIILIEDIDRYSLFTEKNESESCMYNKSGILNMLDGVMSPARRIVIGTTNNIGVLDPTVLRSGRFDNHIEFVKPNTQEKIDIFRYFLNRDPSSQESESLKDSSTADLFKYINDTIINEKVVICQMQQECQSTHSNVAARSLGVATK